MLENELLRGRVDIVPRSGQQRDKHHDHRASCLHGQPRAQQLEMQQQFLRHVVHAQWVIDGIAQGDAGDLARFFGLGDGRSQEQSQRINGSLGTAAGKEGLGQPPQDE